MPSANLVCFRCDGAKVVYQSALGEHRQEGFRAFEPINLLANGQLAEAQCPECKGAGTLAVPVAG